MISGKFDFYLFWVSYNFPAGFKLNLNFYHRYSAAYVFKSKLKSDIVKHLENNFEYP